MVSALSNNLESLRYAANERHTLDPGHAPLACSCACYSATAFAILDCYEHQKSRW
jgi:hypothetical protein